MLSPSTPHLVMMWPFGKKGRQSLRLGISTSCLFTPTIISVIPPKPLFSLLTNIPQVTFPICLNSDSLTGVSAGNLDNSQCGLIFTVRTDGENWDLEISLEYYDLAQSLGTRGSGRTDMLYLSWAFGSPWMLLTSFENPCSIGFAIHQHVSTTVMHVFPILITAINSPRHTLKNRKKRNCLSLECTCIPLVEIAPLFSKVISLLTEYIISIYTFYC